MKTITIYNVSTGEITRVVNCPDDVIHLQLSPGEALVEGFSNDATQMVVDGEIVDKEPPSDLELNAVALWELRNIRDELLVSSDWTQLPDNALSDATKALWAVYRQQLRDLTYTYADILNISEVNFPSPPN
tara:strand:- start:515 stop:907 length:393 start_codon:yes stop_codon:yes gene_type:complete